MNSCDLAVVGATGAVGEAMLEILGERQFPADNVYALASEKSAGKRLPFRGGQITVQCLDSFDFSKVQIGLFSAGGKLSAEYAPKAAASGCVVIDNTSYFRRDADIPLVVPEVNSHKIGEYTRRNIIANPNCSTIQMLVALKPIYDAVGISRIDVATYQAVSGAGRAAIKELAGQTADILNARPITSNIFPRQIAFNALPQIGDFEENGYTLEEMKMIWETRKIFDDEKIEINPTCVRIPVFYGHAEAVHIKTRKKLSAADARALLESADGVVLMDDPQNNGYPVPVTDSAGQDGVYVGRVRENLFDELGLNLWIVSDNVRKGAALNSIQIAELLIKSL